MADIHDLEHQRKKDKLVAHIALGAEGDKGPTGECLSPEELGDVAAGICSKEEKQRALDHFANCRKCYNAWVAISFAIASVERGERKPKRTLVTFKNLTYLGSAFAIAASVMVFLNLKDVQKQILRKSPAVQMESVQDGVSRTADSEPSPALKRQKVTPQSPQSATIETSMALEERKAAVNTGTVSRGAAGGESSDKVQAWLDSVRDACTNRHGSPTEQLIRALSAEGLALDLSEKASPKKEQVDRILELMSGERDESKDWPCSEIRALLAENAD